MQKTLAMVGKKFKALLHLVWSHIQRHRRNGLPANDAEAAGDISGDRPATAARHSAEEAPHSAPLHWELGGRMR